MPSVIQAATITGNADYTNLAEVVKDPLDASLLQKDLDVIHKRTEEDMMQLNARRFQTLHSQPVLTYCSKDALDQKAAILKSSTRRAWGSI